MRFRRPRRLVLHCSYNFGNFEQISGGLLKQLEDIQFAPLGNVFYDLIFLFDNIIEDCMSRLNTERIAYDGTAMLTLDNNRTVETKARLTEVKANPNSVKNFELFYTTTQPKGSNVTCQNAVENW